MSKQVLSKQQARELLNEIIEGWTSEASGPAIATDPNHPYAQVYEAALSLIDFTSNLAYSLNLIKAVVYEAAREGEDLDWISGEIWFEIRGSGNRSRQQTALAELKRSHVLTDAALDLYNRRVQRLKPVNPTNP
ncbi:hypothetical protein [Spirosoma sp. KNUC1025]|uniref:hypothetical protein n=1 Tax=Spirosoma sp. KNUC1025 TaxID=2894082 RepID=UPI001E5BF130|nr:hypothetical protein [Spirosoma sp. KNUC1025]UFH57715.1 hypothetical protein LN737_32320 [Spirosoma sp. KNUC1025]